ncbi:MAG: hypothetical protein ACJ04P_13175 [Halioglobus sp.]
MYFASESKKIHVHKSKTQAVSSGDDESSAGNSSQRGYERHRGFKGGNLSHDAPNILDREFEAVGPNRSWITGFTNVRTHED